MRSLRATILASCVLAAACGNGGGGDGGDDDGASPDASGGPAEGFRITTPDIAIMPGEEVTYCYFTTLTTAREMGVKRWSSTMTPGSHHLILFFSNSGQSQPDGTIQRDCDGIGGGGGSVPYWAYSAQTPVSATPMPTGVGMKVNAGQKVYVQMHYVNTSDEVLMAHVEIDGEAYAAAETYTPAAAFVTYRSGFSVPANSTGNTGGNCAIPAGSKFFLMSTHAHKRATLTRVSDGGTMVFESDDWEHPGAKTWSSDPFYTFTSNRLTYYCEYDNTGNSQPVQEGPSAKTDEMCMAVGYFFPATGPKICVNDFVVPN